ncbi:MAG TPA: VCBS repeat-containing protein [Vicinamibacterales bacterium]|nr:VCBS repeat-containing protein [Vicinamibacterales bacterium]
MAAPDFGLSFEFTKKATWPDYTPPGWDGPLEYTVWAVVNVNGHWYTSGFIQMWRERASTGAPLLTIPAGSAVNNFAKNWAYDARWGPMSYSVSGYQPHAGETVGFFVSAGNARGIGTVTSLRERSNVVTVSLPANDTGTFSFPATGTPASAPTGAMLAGDFNGDSVPDIIAQSKTGVVTLALGSGTTFTQVQSPYNNVTSAWSIVGTGDFNGDHRVDLVWQSSTGAVTVWLNNGSSAPTYGFIWTGETVWRVVAVADMDQDGSPDVIWQSPTGQVAVWYMRGFTVVRTENLSTVATSWRIAGVADFNGDGNGDLVWQGPNGEVVIWTMRGPTQTSAYVLSSVATVWRVLSVGDLNGDGKPDLFWGSPTGQLVAWTMSGFTITGTPYVKAATTGWQLSTTP